MSHTFRFCLPVAKSSPLVVVMACLLLPVSGCGNGSGTATVSGKITYQGKPVTNGLINFMPSTGRPLGGGIRPDGTYEFRLPPGEYKVRIDTPPALPQGWKEGDPPPKMGPRQVPYQYGHFQTSGLTASVGPQDDILSINFELK